MQVLSSALADLLHAKYRFSVETAQMAARASFKCEYCSADMLASLDAYEWN